MNVNVIELPWLLMMANIQIHPCLMTFFSSLLSWTLSESEMTKKTSSPPPISSGVTRMVQTEWH